MRLKQNSSVMMVMIVFGKKVPLKPIKPLTPSEQKYGGGSIMICTCLSSNGVRAFMLNPWRYSSEEPRPTEAVAARWQYRGPCG